MRKTKTLLYLLCCIICIGAIIVLKAQQSKKTGYLEHNISVPTLSPTQSEYINDSTALPEDQIYSFLQGPKSWEHAYTWSGAWAEAEMKGNKFGSFGCGLCAMANIYSTLSTKVCSPVDMYQYAKEVSDYHPSYGAGAIDWTAMQQTLEYCGFSSTLHNKPEKLKTFIQDAKKARCTLVLVSSYYSDKFWKNTPGHYVLIWNYNPKEHTVFLTDSGSPERNRSVIPIKYVFTSLKESSSYQYMTIDSYDEQANQWNWDTITETWHAPSYFVLEEK